MRYVISEAGQSAGFVLYMAAYRHAYLQEARICGDVHVREPAGRGGKTTVTLGLAAALAGAGPAVLVVDFDPQASATRLLAVDVDDRRTIADVMLEEHRVALSDALVATAWGFYLARAENGARLARVAWWRG